MFTTCLGRAFRTVLEVKIYKTAKGCNVLLFRQFSSCHTSLYCLQSDKMNLPNIPYSFKDFTSHLEAAKTRDEVNQVLEPFKTYEAKLRQIYAQEPDHDAVSQDHLVPIYQAGKADLKTKARNVSSETKDEREKFLLPLSNKQRRKEGTGAITSSLKEFQKNFNVFSESALVDLDWSNIVAAGSSVVTPLLPAGNHGESKVRMPSSGECWD